MKSFVDSLELKSFSPLYQSMAEVAPQVLINLEILLDNFFDLGLKYHSPKNFVTVFNNFERSVYFFIESSKKGQLSHYSWLKNAINKIISEFPEIVTMHKEIRRKSTHISLLVPDDASIIFGLYRIKNNQECILKLGLGDVGEKRKTDLTQYLYSDTEKIFNEILFFHETFFIDNEHSSLGECLGVSRNWFADIEYKFNKNKRKKRINLYEEATKICQLLVSEVSIAFTQNFDAPYSQINLNSGLEFNFVNTVLEIDLYPELFKKQWENPELKPFNYKYLKNYELRNSLESRNNFYVNAYNNIIKNPTEYLDKLENYIKVNVDTFENQLEYNLFLEFLYFNHLNLKANFLNALTKSNSVIFGIAARLRKAIESYILNIDSNFQDIPPSKINSELSAIGAIVGELHKALVKYNDENYVNI
ncbi:MAG: hypothetical protein ACEPO8_09880 [Rhodothermaceae bacterium]